MDVKPFLIDDPARFRSVGPNKLTSAKYAREFDEVKQLGSLTSSTRTADQTDMARFWADNARLFAMLYVTGADAIISCWRDKAHWVFWRPITAIHEAAGDTTWRPLINTPPYPDHPSGLSCVGGSHASTLRDFLGTDAAEFSITSSVSQTTRSFASFSQAIDEIVDARVYSGIHFRTADTKGALLCRQIARYRERHHFHPERGHSGWEGHFGGGDESSDEG